MILGTLIALGMFGDQPVKLIGFSLGSQVLKWALLMLD